MKKLFVLSIAALAAASVSRLAAQDLKPFDPLPPSENSEQASLADHGYRPLYESGYELSKWRIALDVAFSYRTAKAAEGQISGVSESDWRRFVNGLRPGIAYGMSITPFFNDNFGVGLRFAGNHYSHTSDGGLSDNINTFYIAPEFVWRAPTFDNKNALIWTVSIGYLAYGEKMLYSGSMAEIRKGGFKTATEIGYDFRIGAKSFFGLKLGLSTGGIRIDVGEEDQMESIGAIEIGGGFRF